MSTAAGVKEETSPRAGASAHCGLFHFVPGYKIRYFLLFLLCETLRLEQERWNRTVNTHRGESFVEFWCVKVSKMAVKLLKLGIYLETTCFTFTPHTSSLNTGVTDQHTVTWC